MLFRDRVDGGCQLAKRLTQYKDEDTIVLALPRGGVPVGYEIARALESPLDVIIARKIGAPFQPELGIGAIAPGDVRIIDEQTVKAVGASEEQIERIVAEETVEMEQWLRSYRGNRPMPEICNRTVILVDDGVATGVTARAAIRAIRKQKPRKLILAVPVGAPETIKSLRSEVDDIVCVETPHDFRAVGLWYHDFRQTSDEEVIELLEHAQHGSNTGMEFEE